ncbi:hypothetical protein COHA_008972 [Chlorella ohadii]|uniref:Uncharacterized protein n=1 Tax=Chlorella ohadii TaxID=2649997 RepID=A0AAD5DMP3_9CHLO|nr:hypothetical protein COHA_008972 [Chlorella ohadii]
MPPKKEDKLAGRQVLAPPSLWPDFPLPKGQKGWAGLVGKKKDAKHHFVTFPDSGDNSKQQQQEEAARPSKKGKAAVVAAEDTESMNKEALKQLILSTIEPLDKEQLRTVYKTALDLKLGKR